MSSLISVVPVDTINETIRFWYNKYMQLEQKYKIIAGVEFISAASFLVFWIGYYLSGSISVFQTTAYTTYQGVFPFPDSILVPLLMTAGFMTLKNKKSGKVLSIICAFFFILLGVSGFDLKLSSGMHLMSMIDMASITFINLWCTIFGLYIPLKIIQKKEQRWRALR